MRRYFGPTWLVLGRAGMPAPAPALGRRPDVGGQAPGPVSDITNAADAAPHSVSM